MQSPSSMETVNCDCYISRGRLFSMMAQWFRNSVQQLRVILSLWSDGMSVTCVDSDEWDVGCKPEPCRNTANLAALENTQMCIVQLARHFTKLGRNNCELWNVRLLPVSISSVSDRLEWKWMHGAHLKERKRGGFSPGGGKQRGGLEKWLCQLCLDVKVELQLMEENIKAGKVTSSEVAQE